jgi:hypothetical protein
VIVCLQEGLGEPSLLYERSLLTDGELHVLKAAERSRMVLSNVDNNFIATNAEPAYKAAAVYTKAKVVKKILGNKACIL